MACFSGRVLVGVFVDWRRLISMNYRRVWVIGSTLADAVEAIIAAIYLDAGLDAARACVLAWLGERMATLDDAESLKDPKTRLQEMLQADQQALPEYRVESMDGPEHQRRFTVSCRVAGWAQAFVGSGVSRRKAEQAAALLALQALDGQHGS